MRSFLFEKRERESALIRVGDIIKKKRIKNNYLKKIECIIDNLMCVFLQSSCVKQKKANFMLKQMENLKRIKSYLHIKS